MTDVVTVRQLARALGVEHAEPLPEGYTRLEYIESDGRQYIDTGYFPCELTRVVTAITPTSGNTTNGVFGGRTDNEVSTFSLWCVNGVYRTDFDTNSQHVTTDVKVETGVRVEVDKDQAWLEDVHADRHGVQGGQRHARVRRQPGQPRA